MSTTHLPCPPLPRGRAAAAGLALALLAAGLVSAQRPGPKAAFELRADRTAYEPGAVATLAAVVTVAPGWHVNSHQPTYDYLIPTELELELPEGWLLEQIDYPDGEMQRFSFAELPLSVYDGEMVIRARVRIGPEKIEGAFPVDARLTYQACDDRSCLPPDTIERRGELLVAAGGAPVEEPLFGASTAGPSRPARPAGLPFGWMLVLGALGGLLLNAMPCVLPVLSLKLFGLVKSAGQGRGPVVFGSLATAAGIVLSFWLLAAAAVAARAAGQAVGWGVQFQEPVFVALLLVIVLLFCFNLWGLFEIPLPARLARWADSGPRQGLPGHLAAGLFATLMATPCSAPFLGTALGFALGQPPVTVFAAFTAIAFGMALPYLALAVFPAAVRLMPAPGAWMERLKGVMGFLLAAAAVWLLYVLAAQLSRERLAYLELAALAMALGVWWGRTAAGGSGWRKLAGLATAAAAAAMLLLAAGGRAPRPGLAAPAAGLIDWVPWERAEAEGLAAEGRLVFVALLLVIVLLFCFNLWGLFEIPLPARLARWADSGPRQGLPGHLAAGLFATLMATPCSAPFLGTALGFALGQPPVTVFAAFTAIAFGMALPYLALAVFPAAVRLLPAPGAWMERLKGVMGFLLAAAAVWLLYVLAAQLSRERLAYLELAALAMALGVWWGRTAAAGSGWRKLAGLATAAAAAAMLLLAAGGRAPQPGLAAPAAGLIDWVPWERAEAEGLAAEGRLVFVDVTADWCFTCKVNERLVLETPEVAEAFRRYRVVAMKADWTNRADDITEFLAEHGRYGIPFYLLYRPEREPLLFSELLTRDAVIEAVAEAAGAAAAGP